MSADLPKIVGYDGQGVAGARVLGATWEDDPAAPRPAAGSADQATDGAQERQEEST
jgi:hypothetical protein